MNYELKKAEIYFDSDGKPEFVITTADCGSGGFDVRTTVSYMKKEYWKSVSELLTKITPIFQETFGHSSAYDKDEVAEIIAEHKRINNYK
jgi:hypothetical protein